VTVQETSRGLCKSKSTIYRWVNRWDRLARCSRKLGNGRWYIDADGLVKLGFCIQLEMEFE
jgi:transposase-like protein